MLLAVLRPWSAKRTGKRFVVALPLLGVWFGLLLVGAMHQGGVYHVHLMWIFGCWIGCMATAVYEQVLGRYPRKTEAP